MEPFDALTPRGQIGRLRGLGGVALEQYALDAPRASLLKQTFNTLFRVVDAHGHKTALRVGARERIHTPETESVETAWLTALRAETAIDAPLPIANAAGSFVTHAQTNGVPEARTCVLFEWARGRRLGDLVSRGATDAGRASEVLGATAGELLARLHEHGTTFEAGRRQPVIAGDNVVSFLLPDRLPRDDPQYGTLFADAFDRAQAAIDGLWARPPHPPHLLHGDFHPNNILVRRGHLTPIDFQDALWGFEIQDVAITTTAIENYGQHTALMAAFRAGYERVRPWPADDVQLVADLVGARHLSVLNLGYNIRRPGLDAFIARHAECLRAWMAR